MAGRGERIADWADGRVGLHRLAKDNMRKIFPDHAVLGLIAVYPFVEAWITKDAREHHLLDRPRNAPVRTALGAAWISLYLVTLVGGGNDLFATHLHLSLNAMTWAVRVGFFVAPVLVFEITRRWCLGLQRRDRDLVLHGRETGVIKKLPHGEYVEAHEPLPAARVHLLTAHEQYRPAADGRSLRARLSRAYFGGGGQVAKATREERERLVAGHGGHAGHSGHEGAGR